MKPVKILSGKTTEVETSGNIKPDYCHVKAFVFKVGQLYDLYVVGKLKNQSFVEKISDMNGDHSTNTFDRQVEKQIENILWRRFKWGKTQSSYLTAMTFTNVAEELKARNSFADIEEKEEELDIYLSEKIKNNQTEK